MPLTDSHEREEARFAHRKGDESAAKPQRWQFGIRQMLIAVTATAVVFGVFRWFDLPTSSALVCLALVIYGSFFARNARGPLLVILVCMYLPYSWLVWDNYPWNDYRWGWIGMWPILPGIIPGAYFFHQVDETFEFACMAIAALLFAAVAVFAGTRGRRSLIVTAIFVLTLSIANAYFAYAAFRA